MAAGFEEIIGKSGKIGLNSGLDDGGVGLISLDENLGGIKMAAADATDNLSKELKSTLFGGKIGQGKAGIGLNDAD